MTGLAPLNEPVEDEVIAAPLDEIREHVALFMDARERRREAQAEEDEERDIIRGFLDEYGAEFGSVGGKIVVRDRSMTVRRFNKKALAKDHPDLVDRYTQPNEERRMEVVTDDEE